MLSSSILLLFLAAGAEQVRGADKWTLTSTKLPSQDAWQQQPYVSNGYISHRIPSSGFGYAEITPKNASGHDGTSGWPLFDSRYTVAMVAGFYDSQGDTAGTNFVRYPLSSGSSYH